MTKSALQIARAAYQPKLNCMVSFWAPVVW